MAKPAKPPLDFWRLVCYAKGMTSYTQELERRTQIAQKIKQAIEEVEQAEIQLNALQKALHSTLREAWALYGVGTAELSIALNLSRQRVSQLIQLAEPSPREKELYGPLGRRGNQPIINGRPQDAEV